MKKGEDFLRVAVAN